MPDTIVQEALDAYEAAMAADRTNRAEAVTDLKYIAGEQWDSVVLRERQATNRMTLQFNQLGQRVRQVTGDMRLNPPAIKVRPVDSGADPKTAETYTGLIRNIEAQSDGQDAYLTAADNAVKCGEGWFGLTYDYPDDMSFDMDLMFRRIASPFAVLADPDARDPTRADAQYMFLSQMVSEARFKELYPDASLTGWGSDWPNDWREGDFIRVCEWWRRVPERRHLLRLGNGAVVDVTEMPETEVRAMTAQTPPVGDRWVESSRIEMRLLTASDELKDPYRWIGRHIPLIRVAGDETNIGDRVVRHGIVRHARDAQTLYNIQRNAFTELANMAPKAKWMMTVKQVAGQENAWGAANRSNAAYLTYTPDPAAGGPPQRIAPDAPAANLVQDFSAAKADIDDTTGIHRENLGKESNAQSGKAILSRQREGDVGSFLYMDNLTKSVTQAGRVLIDMIPRVYDTARTVRILGEDGTEKFVPINTTDPITGKIINDLSVGRYDVVASVGPSYSTRREEGREFLIAAMQAVPAFGQLGADILASMMDGPGADELAERLRKDAVAKGLTPPKEGEPPPPPPKPDPAAMLAQAETIKAQAALVKAQADAQAKQGEMALKAQQAQLDAQIDAMDMQLRAEELAIRKQEAIIKAQATGAQIVVSREQMQLRAIEVAADTALGIAEHRSVEADRTAKRAQNALATLAAPPVAVPPGMLPH